MPQPIALRHHTCARPRTGVLAAALLASLAAAVASAQDRASEAHATIEVARTSGGRTEADVTPVLPRLRSALARCADAAREGSGAEVGVVLDVSAAGRASASPQAEASGAAAFQRCVVTALGRVRLPAGSAGTVELRVGWYEPRSYGTATLGGFRSRSSALPTHPRTERAPEPYPDAQIASVAQEHDAEVRHCFASALAHRPDVAGTVRLRFTIGSDGAVSDASVESDDVHAPAVTTCLLGRVATWTFPAPPSGSAATVTHAFVLR